MIFEHDKKRKWRPSDIGGLVWWIDFSDEKSKVELKNKTIFLNKANRFSYFIARTKFWIINRIESVF